MKYITKGIMYLYPACMWIFILVGIVAAAHLNGNSQIARKGAIVLICFSVAVLVTAYAVGYLLREQTRKTP